MRGCGNGLRSAKPGSHSAEKRAEVVLGTGERFGPKPEHDGYSVLHLPRLGGEHFTAADSFIRITSVYQSSAAQTSKPRTSRIVV